MAGRALVKEQALTAGPHARAYAACMCLLPLLAGCHRLRFPQVPVNYREYAYVANSGGGTVSVLDLVHFRQDRTLRVGDQPTDLAVNPTRSELYVVNTAGASISVIDATQNSVSATIPVHKTPVSISVDAKGERAYVANKGANTVSVLDLKTRREVLNVGTGEEPGQVRISPDGRSLVVANQGSGSVSLYEVSGEAKPRLRAAFAGCPGAADIAVMQDSSKAFVACPDGGSLLSIGLASAPGSWQATQDPASMQDRLLARLRVGKTPAHLALKPDGGELFVSNAASNSVSEVSTFTNEVGGTFKIGTGPAQGLVSTDNGTLWVTNSGAESVSLYSIDEGRMTNSIHTGPQPGAIAMSPKQPILLVANAKSGDVAVIRTRDTNGPELLTMLPAGSQPVAIAIKAFQVP